MQSFKKLSVIIVNYRSEQYLKNCVASLFKHLKDSEFEVIVVNNDNSEIFYPDSVRIINIRKNIGFGAACNVGAKAANGMILWFLNPDTEIVSEKTIELIHEFNKDADVGIIGPRLIDESGKTQEWIAGKKITIGSTILNNFGYKRDKKIWNSQRPVECAWVTGGAMFVRKSLFERLGGFDEKFFMYFEDVDLCRRACGLGYKILYYPQSSVVHGSGKSKQSFFRQKAQFYRSMVHYFLR